MTAHITLCRSRALAASSTTLRPMASIQKTATGYRARYRDSSKKEHLKRFKLKKDAQRWLDQETNQDPDTATG